MAGTYTTNDRMVDVVRVTRSGKSNGWITFRNYPGARPTIFNQHSWQGVNIYGASYVIIEGLEVMGNNTILARTNVRSLTPHDPETNGNCIMAQRGNGALPHHLVFRNNSIHDCPGAGIGTSYADYVTIQQNIVYNTSWWSKWGTSGISIYKSQNTDTGDCHNYHIFVLNNVVYDNRQTQPTQGQGKITDGNGIIIDDLNNSQSKNPSYRGRVLVQNNVSYHNGGRGIHVYHSDHVDVINNTTFGNGVAELSAVFVSDVQFVNNIAYARAGRYASYVYGKSDGLVYIDNLLFNGLIGVHGEGDLVQDPLFFNAPAGDFRLRPGSPAIDSGSSRLAPTRDIGGVVRPSGTGYDRGAYRVPILALIIIMCGGIVARKERNGAASETVRVSDLIGPGTESVYQVELELLESHIRRLGIDGRTLEILEAGCGRQWYFPMRGIAFRLTGVDLDAGALEARKVGKGDLAEAFCGDLRTIDLPPQRYDVIYSAFVLEHVPGARSVLERFVGWLRPGGIIILRIPDRNSVHGFVTRTTPFWLHVLYHRVVWRNKNAGKPGFDPYPTTHDRVISQCGIREFARQYGLTICEEVGQGGYSRGPLLCRVLVPVFAQVVTLVTFGRIHNRFTDLAYVLEKPRSQRPRGGRLPVDNSHITLAAPTCRTKARNKR